MKKIRVLLVLATLAGVGYFFYSRHGIASSGPRPRIEIFKSARELVFVDEDGRSRRFPVALGSNPIPPKEREGDGATPEGTYFVCSKNPHSKYFLSLGLSYPGPHDAERGRAAGVISDSDYVAIQRAAAEGTAPPWKTALGGEIFIHGRGSKTDWTQGCVALEDPDMTELYAAIEVGIPVIIHP